MAETTALTHMRQLVQHAGYYPELVLDTVETALAGEQIEAALVQQETTFDGDEVRRHVTVLALTPTRLLVSHTDDSTDAQRPPVATSSTEAVPLSGIASVVVTRVVDAPDRYRPGALPEEVTVTLGWGAVGRVDLEPAGCSDPDCEADHGYTGTVTADDLSLRISATADGEDAVRQALVFARALSAATVRVASRA
ncbi:hypothetical protein EV189_3385 [Motilibacter rhizosphaerae]|uniref:Phosphodiesterase n=1 Tax=Motilibacter rhizosphaerae TaxID=598652 RepID=A0A4Q7NGB4_9ACTN|nr:DUF5998 family protein [Motilibacter rhizosphaerae]RZS82987.1 hypothetical protein EV189_3385 [Motilibacter rhizosphaerae]